MLTQGRMQQVSWELFQTTEKEMDTAVLASIGVALDEIREISEHIEEELKEDPEGRGSNPAPRKIHHP